MKRGIFDVRDYSYAIPAIDKEQYAFSAYDTSMALFSVASPSFDEQVVGCVRADMEKMASVSDDGPVIDANGKLCVIHKWWSPTTLEDTYFARPTTGFLPLASPPPYLYAKVENGKFAGSTGTGTHITCARGVIDRNSISENSPVVDSLLADEITDGSCDAVKGKRVELICVDTSYATDSVGTLSTSGDKMTYTFHKQQEVLPIVAAALAYSGAARVTVELTAIDSTHCEFTFINSSGLPTAFPGGRASVHGVAFTD